MASEPIAVERLPPAEPHLAQPFLKDACRSVLVRDNRAELAAAAAWTEAEEAHGVQLHAELKRQSNANSQELRVVKASIASQVPAGWASDRPPTFLQPSLNSPRTSLHQTFPEPFLQPASNLPPAFLGASR